MEHRWNRLVAGLFAIGVAATLTGDASASRPKECKSGDGARGYNEGYNLQSNLLDFIWQSFDCNSVEDFIRVVDVPFSPRPSGSTYLDCRNVGISDAIIDSIYDKQRSCLQKCSKAGADQGRLNAQMYCGLPSRFSANESLSLCDNAIWQSCRGAFTSFVNANCPENRSRDPKGFNNFMNLACPAP